MAEFAGLFEGASASEQVSGIFDQAADVFGGSKSASSGGGAPAASGAWSFDSEQVNSLIAKWEKLRDECQNDGMDLQQLSSVFGAQPSEDSPSVKYTSLVADGLGSVRESNVSMVAYIQDFIEKLKAARDGIQRTEDANTDPFQAAKSVFGA